MVLGAFIDMGVPTQWLAGQIGNLDIGTVEITCEDVRKNGIGAKKVHILEKSTSSARTFQDIVQLIERGAFEDSVKTLAVKIFRSIADAEAKIHRCRTEDVHFHEVGAVDSIVDIVGAALCLDYFKIKSVSSSALPLGSGFVECSHGRLPVPAPATLEILKGIPVYGGNATGEMVTPTGAGIVATLCEEFGPVPPMQVARVGYGSGTIDRETIPNLLRILIGSRDSHKPRTAVDDICVVETNIDDMNPEICGFVMEKLLADGALDVCFTPVTMKKNRPGIKIEVLCSPEKRESVATFLLTETTTAGVRYTVAARQILERSNLSIQTCFGEVQVKELTDPAGGKRYTPEYDACRKIALDDNIPLQRVYQAVADAIKDMGALDKTSGQV